MGQLFLYTHNLIQRLAARRDGLKRGDGGAFPWGLCRYFPFYYKIYIEEPYVCIYAHDRFPGGSI